MTKLNLILWVVSLTLQCLLLAALFLRGIARRIPVLAILIGFYIVRSAASYTISRHLPASSFEFVFSGLAVVDDLLQTVTAWVLFSAAERSAGELQSSAAVGLDGSRELPAEHVDAEKTCRVLRVSDRGGGVRRSWFDGDPREPPGTSRPRHFVYLDGLPSGFLCDGCEEDFPVDSQAGCRFCDFTAPPVSCARSVVRSRAHSGTRRCSTAGPTPSRLLILRWYCSGFLCCRE